MSDKAESTLPPIVTFLRKREYQMVRELGSGACGRTVLLWDDIIDEHFVCKKYSPYSDTVRAELFLNFTREIKLLHQLHHPNVVRVFNYYLYPDTSTGYILMEFVDGFDVDDYIAAHPEKLNDVFLQVLNGFAHLEQVGVLHRDIRPGNLMVTKDGVVKIIDLGFGKQINAPNDFDKSITLAWWCDTPAEFGSRRYDFATEVYFVGKLFEKLITENEISYFDQPEVLRNMCLHDPDTRIKSFTSLLQQLRSGQFAEMSFSIPEQLAYRKFADMMFRHVTKIGAGVKYFTDATKIVSQLGDIYQKVMLERTIPDCAIVTRCFINGTYFIQKRGFPVDILKDFVALIRSCSVAKNEILFANLYTRLDSIPRYEVPTAGPDAPF